MGSGGLARNRIFCELEGLNVKNNESELFAIPACLSGVSFSRLEPAKTFSLSVRCSFHKHSAKEAKRALIAKMLTSDE